MLLLPAVQRRLCHAVPARQYDVRPGGRHILPTVRELIFYLKYRNMACMKTSIDLPDELYRRVKSKSALQGKAVREVATALFTAWVDGRVPDVSSDDADLPTVPVTRDLAQQWLTRWRAVGAEVSRSDAGASGLMEQLRHDRR